MRMLAAIAAIFWSAGCATTGVEEPTYTRLSGEGAFEIREYAPTIVAETTVTGDAVRSRYAGFTPLADYIFAKDRKGDKIAMTAPVTQTPREKIAMTAPVIQAKSQEGWTVAFTMPSGYSLKTLPAPTDPAVHLAEQPARTMAVIRYSGFADEATMRTKQQELLAAVATAGFKAVGEPVHAFYDPPWTLPFFRRNEVMIEVAR